MSAAKERGGKPAFTLRAHRPSDMDWVIERHGALYAQDYGWGAEFEALIAGIVADFARTCDPRRERCWIAELDGEPVGSVFLVRTSDAVAKLRLLLVEPKARGLGIGRALVEQCIEFARAAGYSTMTLWTQSVLTGARKIYRDQGFKRVATAQHREWGVDVVGETWEISLSPVGGGR